MKLLKRSWGFVLVLLFFYSIYYLLVPYLPVDDLTKKGLIVNNVLFYSPLVTFLVSLVYAASCGFSFSFSLLAGLSFLVTVFPFGEWIPLYHVVYFLFSLLGNGFGQGIYYLRKKSMEKP